MTVTILGAGLAGLSCSHFFGHEHCIIFERNNYLGGHIATHYRDGCYWDEGPHVSFTKHQEVRALLAWSSSSHVLEYPTTVANTYQGSWIPHPAQSNLSFVPEPLARVCLDDFLSSRADAIGRDQHPPEHYGEWLDRAFGHTFANTFSKAYTEKYWTCHPELLTVDWVGERVFYPDIDTVKQGYYGHLDKNTHYITSVRYPETGGYASFASGISQGANVHFGAEVYSIDLVNHIIRFSDGSEHSFDHLINTLPLNKFTQLVCHSPDIIRESAKSLSCSEMLLVNIKAKGPSLQPYHWLYVYDQDMYSTRINQTHLLSPSNTPSDSIGIQVEVYASRYRPFPESHDMIARKVVGEVRQLGLASEIQAVHTQYVPYANVIFDHPRRQHQDRILDWLTTFGMEREEGDLDPMTDWGKTRPKQLATLNLAGRFGQWKYYWTDDCIMRGKQLSSSS
jgi:protoporphyrinogen oxidase